MSLTVMTDIGRGLESNRTRRHFTDSSLDRTHQMRKDVF